MDGAARILRLLSLLQVRAHWPGDLLADRLGVTARTLRRDVVRLRSLGYPVEADPGTGGGYRLGAGGRLPPLLLDDDEAVAIAVGLRVATATAVHGIEDAAVAALAKLDGLLPARLRDRVDALRAGTVQFPNADTPRIDTEVLITLAAACRRTEGIRFRYTDNDGRGTARCVEPLRVVHTGRRWYLVARDRDRDAWRTFRVDRIGQPVPTGHRFHFEDPPDPVALVSEGTTYAPYELKARIRVHAGAGEVARVIPPSVAAIEPVDPATCLVKIAATGGYGQLVGFVCGLPFEAEVLDPPELRARLAGLGAALVRRYPAGGTSRAPAATRPAAPPGR